MIQGLKGYICSTETMNRATTFQIVLNDGQETELHFDENHHRLYYEFREFIRMVNEKDYEEAGRVLDQSVIVSEMMEEARWNEKIFFTNDRKIISEVAEA